MLTTSVGSFVFVSDPMSEPFLLFLGLMDQIECVIHMMTWWEEDNSGKIKTVERNLLSRERRKKSKNVKRKWILNPKDEIKWMEHSFLSLPLLSSIICTLVVTDTQLSINWIKGHCKERFPSTLNVYFLSLNKWIRKWQSSSSSSDDPAVIQVYSFALCLLRNCVRTFPLFWYLMPCDTQIRTHESEDGQKNVIHISRILHFLFSWSILWKMFWKIVFAQNTLNWTWNIKTRKGK